MYEELSKSSVHPHGESSYWKHGSQWGFKKSSAFRIVGRHLINIWRAMKGELILGGYTLENVTFHLLNRRFVHILASTAKL